MQQESAPLGTLADVMDAHIKRVLVANNYNVSKSARVLDVNRCTLQRWMRRQALHP